MSGQACWGRLSVRDTEPGDEPRRAGMAPSRATPITLALRDDLPWLLRAARGDLTPAEPPEGRTRDVLDALRQHGALFRTDLAAQTGRLPYEIDEALWEGVARGLVTADGFRAVRALLRRGRPERSAPTRGLRRGLRASTGATGRWSLLPGAGRRRRPGRAGGGGRRAARRALGRGLPRPGGPGEPRRALARCAVGVPPDGGQGHHARRPVRDRIQRRAVRPPGRASTC